MYVSEADMNEAAAKLLAHMIDDEKFMVTVFCGKDSTQEQRETLEARLEEEYPEVEVYFIEGGQDVYPYIFIVE
jgi:dihydroxyacetone kinase-like predicted kinase